MVEEESTNAVDIRDGSFVWEAAGTLEGKKGGKDAKKGDGKKEKGAGKKETKGEDETKGLREKLFKKKAQTAGKGESEKDILPTHSSRTSTTVAPAPSPPPEEDKPFSLHSISLRIPKKSFVAIVGRVGSGKSSLLNAMIGEMRKVRGDIVLGGTIAYVPQQAWIMNASLKENVLFGQEDDDER